MAITDSAAICILASDIIMKKSQIVNKQLAVRVHLKFFSSAACLQKQSPVTLPRPPSHIELSLSSRDFPSGTPQVVGWVIILD